MSESARQWWTRAQFAAHAAKGEPIPPTVGLREGFETTLVPIEDAPADDRRLQFVISTSGADRMRDVIQASGWNLAPYQGNPVMLWSHDYDVPAIATAERTWVEGDRLHAVSRFAPADVHPFAHMIYRLYQEGILAATSVGFQPDEWTYDEERKGYNFLRQTLLEFSAVNVPANADCLIEARTKGIDVTPYRAWAEQALEAAHGPGFWVSRATLEGLWRAAGVQPTISLPPAPVPEPPAPKSAAPIPDEPLRFELVEDATPRLTVEDLERAWQGRRAPADVQPADLASPSAQTVIQRATASIVREVVKDAVTAALNRARGRVD